MSEQHHHAETTEGSGIERSSTRFASWWPVIAPAIALLVGLLIGGVVVGVANGGDTPSADQEQTASPSGGDATASPTGDPTTVVVPAECLAAVDTVDQLTKLTREAVGAIRDFEPQQLREMLTKLEKLDNSARQQAEACREVKVNSSPDQLVRSPSGG